MSFDIKLKDVFLLAFFDKLTSTKGKGVVIYKYRTFLGYTI